MSNAATARWYEYSWTSHLLSPKPKVFAVRTADSRYAVFEILSYYCPGAPSRLHDHSVPVPGCGGHRVRSGRIAVTASG